MMITTLTWGGSDWEVWREAVVLSSAPAGACLRPYWGRLECPLWRRDLVVALLCECDHQMEGLRPLRPIEEQRARVPIWLQRLALREERPLLLGVAAVGLPDCPRVIVAWEGQTPRGLVAVSSPLDLERRSGLSLERLR